MDYERKGKKRLPNLSETRFADAIDGTKIAYRIWTCKASNSMKGPKSNVPLVMVQGWMGVKEDWAGLDKALCKRINAPVVIIDNRGMGESELSSKQVYSIPLMVNDLFQVIDVALNKPKRVDLFGISMGGCIVQMAALSAPQLVRRIIIGCSTPGGKDLPIGQGLVECIKLFSDPESLANRNPRDIMDDVQRHNLPQWWIEDYPEMFDQLVNDNLRSTRMFAGVVAQSKGLMKFNLSRSVSKIVQKSLIIHGKLDEMVPFESGQALAKMIPSSTFEELEDAGHIFWVTHLAQTVRAVTAFLSAPATTDERIESRKAISPMNFDEAQKSKL